MAQPPMPIRLTGAPNFRDIGGYPARDGWKVVAGRIFRSEMLSGLTDADFELLEAAGVKTIFDLRSDPERKRHPAPERYRDRTVFWSMKSPAGDRVLDMRDLLADPNAARAFMLSAHQAGVPALIAAAIGATIRSIADGAAPCIIHCTFGKDRTGLAAAMLLSLLGVERQHILADYLISNQHRGTHEAMLASWFPNMTAQEMAEIPTQSTDFFLAADAAYIEGALDMIDERYGSIEVYARQVLELDDDTIGRLRSALLEPAG